MNEKELQDKIAILEQTVKALQDLVAIKDQTILALRAQPTVQITQPGLLPYWPPNPQIIYIPAVQPIQSPQPPYTVTCGDTAVQSGGTTGVSLQTNSQPVNHCVSAWGHTPCQ